MNFQAHEGKSHYVVNCNFCSQKFGLKKNVVKWYLNWMECNCGLKLDMWFESELKLCYCLIFKLEMISEEIALNLVELQLLNIVGEHG